MSRCPSQAQTPRIQLAIQFLTNSLALDGTVAPRPKQDVLFVFQSYPHQLNSSGALLNLDRRLQQKIGNRSVVANKTDADRIGAFRFWSGKAK
jgi:hypothetical protein